MANHRMERRGGSEANYNLCRMSLITENLAIAVNAPQCRDAVLHKMVHEIWAVAGRGEQLDYTEIADMFAEGNLDDMVMETLHRGFNILLSKEGL